MSERYQIIIKAGEHSFHFKTKTRVGNFEKFAEEMVGYVDTDWQQMAIELDKRTKEVLEVWTCPVCKSKTQETVIEGQYLDPPSDRNGILTGCTKCKWSVLERL